MHVFSLANVVYEGSRCTRNNGNLICNIAETLLNMDAMVGAVLDLLSRCIFNEYSSSSRFAFKMYFQ